MLSVRGARSGERRRIPEATTGTRSTHTQVTQLGSGPEADCLHLRLPRPIGGGGGHRVDSLGSSAQALERCGWSRGLGPFSGKGPFSGWGLGNLGPALRWDGTGLGAEFSWIHG